MSEYLTKIGKFGTFLLTNFVDEVEFPRLVEGVTAFLKNYCGLDSIAGMDLVKLNHLSKNFDRFRYLSKTAIDAQKVCQSFERYQTGLEKFPSVFNGSVKLIGDGFASLKFLGLIGVTVLAPHVKAFGYIKNICSVYSAAISIISSGAAFIKLCNTNIDPNDSEVAEKRSKRNWQMLKEALIFVGSGCSLGLNGLGGLDSWVGKVIEDAGKQRIPSGFFIGCSILGSGATMATKYLAASAA